MRTIAYHVEALNFSSGGPLQTVALETATTNERLNLTCRAAYDRLRAAFKAKLLAGGIDEDSASRLALLITISIEGAILLSRTYRSGNPLRQTTEYLAATIRHYNDGIG